MRRLAEIAFACVLTVAHVSCSDRPDSVLSEDETVSLIADLQLADACSGFGGAPTSEGDRTRMADGVLAAHGVTREQLDSTIAWYGRNIDDFDKLYAKVDRVLEARRKRLLPESSEEEQSDNIWPFSSDHLLFSRLSGVDHLTFSVDGKTFLKGDQFEWKFRLNKPVDILLTLGASYEDGSSTYVSRQLAGNARPRMTLMTDTSKRVSRLYGILRIRNRESFPVWVDSVYLGKTPVDTTRYYIMNQQHFTVPLATRKLRKVLPDTVPEDSVLSEPRMPEARNMR